MLEPQDGFHHARGAEPIDPSTIEQVGFYLLPSVVRGDFRLSVTSIEALR